MEIFTQLDTILFIEFTMAKACYFHWFTIIVMIITELGWSWWSLSRVTCGHYTRGVSKVDEMEECGAQLQGEDTMPVDFFCQVCDDNDDAVSQVMLCISAPRRPGRMNLARSTALAWRSFAKAAFPSTGDFVFFYIHWADSIITFQKSSDHLSESAQHKQCVNKTQCVDHRQARANKYFYIEAKYYIYMKKRYISLKYYFVTFQTPGWGGEGWQGWCAILLLPRQRWVMIRGGDKLFADIKDSFMLCPFSQLYISKRQSTLN